MESQNITKDSENIVITFKIRKVLINRPWLEENILHYPTIGIRGLHAGAWSSGDLEARNNKGQFPLLPTAMVIAKDVVIKADKFSSEVSSCFKELESNVAYSGVSTLILHL